MARRSRRSVPSACPEKACHRKSATADLRINKLISGKPEIGARDAGVDTGSSKKDMRKQKTIERIPILPNRDALLEFSPSDRIDWNPRRAVTGRAKVR
jgi:hypothetical protein